MTQVWVEGFQSDCRREMQAEIDRLRAELVELKPYCETLNRRLMETGEELGRLRAENAELRILLSAFVDKSLVERCRTILAKTAKD